MNAQDVIRESYDSTNKALKATIVSGTLTGGQATVTLNNTPTIYAVVNTGAVGVGNSIVTVANLPLDTQIVGNVTLSGPLPSGLNNLGFATVAVSNPTLYAVVNTASPGISNSIVTIANTPLETLLYQGLYLPVLTISVSLLWLFLTPLSTLW